MKLNPDLIIELPFCPSFNSYWRSFRGRNIISKKGRVYRDEAIKTCIDQRAYGKKITDRVSVKITLFPPDKKRRDVDNFIKAPLDALTHANVWLDDSQIDKLVVVRGGTFKNGKIVVCIWEKKGE